MDMEELWIEELEVLVDSDKEVCKPLKLVDIAANPDYIQSPEVDFLSSIFFIQDLI